MNHSSYITTASRYRDFLAKVFIKAPDRLEVDFLEPEDQLTVDLALNILKDKLPLVKSRVKSDERMAVLYEMLCIAHEAYSEGNTIKGAHTLQELEGLIWPSAAREVEYELEAKQRLAKNA